jgi:hypothetical protein
MVSYNTHFFILGQVLIHCTEYHLLSTRVLSKKYDRSFKKKNYIVLVVLYCTQPKLVQVQYCTCISSDLLYSVI